MYAMRRANGDLFTLIIDGNDYVALWPDEISARRYKSANPELLVYLPVRIDRSIVERKLKPLATERPLRFWLLDEKDPAAEFESGRIIQWPAVLEAAGYGQDEISRMVEAVAVAPRIERESNRFSKAA
jgi:hypothetical protein